MSEEILSDMLTSDDILGKDVIDGKGHAVGILTKLHIDKKEKKIQGITLDSGFMMPEVFLGIDLVLNFGIDAVYVSHTPSSHYIGKIVFDKYGIIVGTVDKVEYQMLELKTIVVRRGFRLVDIDVSKAKVMKRNIILESTKSEVDALFKESSRRKNIREILRV